MKNIYTLLKSALTILVIICATSINSNAQLNLYDFTSSSGTYTPITGGTVVATATGTSGATSLDDLIYNVPTSTIPFNFNFNGTNYTGLNISTNGFITFGATAPGATDYLPLSSATAFSGAAAAIGGNLNSYFFSGNAAQTGEIRYQTLGTSPNRIFVVQYKNFKTIATSGTTFGPVMNFQIRLLETSNAIECVYSVSGNFASALLQVGLRGINNTYPTNIKNRSITSGVNTWATSINGASNAATCQLSSSLLPALGLTYRYAPTTCASPTDLNVSSVTTNGAVLGWTNPVAGGTFTVEYGALGFTPGTGVLNTTSNTSLPISGLNPQNNYSFYVTKNCGGTSGNSLRIGPFNFSTGALGEDCSTALTLNVASSLGTCSYTTRSSGVSLNGPTSNCSDITGNQANNDVWFKFVAPSNGSKVVITTQAGTVNDWVMELWTFCPGTGSAIKCGDDQNLFMPEIQICQNEYTAGQTYYVRLWTYNSALSGTMSVCVYQATSCIVPPANDACTSATRLTVNPPSSCPANQQVFTTVNATAGTETATCDASTGKLDVWFKFNTGNFNDIQLNIAPITATNLKAQFVFECAGFQINCWNPANGTYNLTGLNPQADYVIRVWTDAAGAGTFSICLNDVCSNPTASISGSQSVCTGQSATIPVTFTGVPPYTFTYSNGTTNTNVTTSNNPYSLIVTPTTSPTTYSLVSMSDGACIGTASGTHVVSIINPQNATLSPFSPICINAGNQTLSGGSPIGGVYSGVGVSGGVFNPSVGTQTITYTVTYASGCSRSASQVFTVNPLPTVVLNSLGTYCTTDAPFTLTGGTPTGGFYSGVGVSGNVFSPSVAGIGSKIITYSATAQGCSSSDTALIVVNACSCPNPPTANAGADKLSCGSSTVSIVGSIGGSATTLIWSGGTGTYSPNSSSSTINYTPSATEISAGFAQLILTANDPDGTGPCVAARDTVRITITSAPTAGTISGTSSLCGATTGISYSLLNQAGVTYTWSVPSNVTITSGQGTNAITTSWASNAVSGLVSCIVGNSCGSSTANFSVTFTNPSTVTLSAFTAVCSNAGTQNLTGGLPTGGVYSGVGVSGSTFNPSSGTQTITYTVTFGTGCSRSASQVFTVNPLPTVTLSSFAAVCSTDPSFTLTGGSPTGGTYSGPGVTGNTFNPSVAGTGTKTITYTFTNASGCTNSATSTIVVNSCGCANPATVNAGANLVGCGSAPVSIVGTRGGSATSSTWSGGAGTYSPNVNSLSITYTPTTAEIAAGQVTLTLTTNDPDGAGPCTAASDAMVITIANSPSVGSITGNASVCRNTSGIVYSVSNQAGVTYSWSVPANVTITAGQGTNSITTSWSGTANSGNVTLTASNACGSSNLTYAVAVRTTTASRPGTITGNSSACRGDVSLYSIVKIANADFYIWTPPKNATINGSSLPVTTTDTSVFVSFSGTYVTDTVRVKAGNCVGVSAERILRVTQRTTVPSTPAVLSGPSSNLCGVTSATYSFATTPAGGLTYTWRTNIVGALINGSSSPVTITNNAIRSAVLTFPANWTGTGIIYVKANNGCGSSTERSLSLTSRPAQPGTITGPVSVCVSAVNQAYSIAAVTGATGYSWTIPTGITLVSGQNTTGVTVNFNATAATRTLTVRASNACGTSASRTLSVTSATCPREGSSISEVSNVDVYPNPVVDLMNVVFESNKQEAFNLTLQDMSGKIMKSQIVNSIIGSNKVELNLSDLSSGIYLLSVQSSERLEQIKVFVE